MALYKEVPCAVTRHNEPGARKHGGKDHECILLVPESTRKHTGIRHYCSCGFTWG